MSSNDKDDFKEIAGRNYIVAFLDILGFKSHVESFINPIGNDAEEIFHNIQAAFEYALDSPYFKEISFDISYKQFSDCTCLSVPNTLDNSEESAMKICNLIYLLREFFIVMILHEMYIRGGLSFGFHYEDDKMIFSEGLIRAYELESKSVYPRIIIDEKLVSVFKELWIEQKRTFSMVGLNYLIVSDWDGTVFINPFKISQTTEKLISEGIMDPPFPIDEKKDIKKQLIEKDHEALRTILNRLENKIEHLKSDKDDNNILKKYLWLKELINWNLNPDSSKIKFEYLLK